MLQYTFYDISTLVHVIYWYRQVTSHYLSQSWPKSMSPYCVTRHRWVKQDAISSHSLARVCSIEYTQVCVVHCNVLAASPALDRALSYIYPYSSRLLNWRRWSNLGFYSLSGQTSYCQISWRHDPARLDVIMIVSLWNLSGILAALLPSCLANFRAIGKV